jgi:uncharacterized protein YaaQ
MLLLLAIVQSEDAPGLAKLLVEQGLRLTQLNSTGGLFGSGNAALLLGIEEAQYDTVIAAIQATCKTRMKHISAVTTPDPTFFNFTPFEVEVGGAVVFCVPVERFVAVPRTSAHPLIKTNEAATGTAQGELPTSGSATEQTNGQTNGQGKGDSKDMKLVVAIVQGEDADAVIRALLAEKHRLTRINTTGGFLRRGNATLLIGVEDGQVDEVIGLIQSSSRHRTEAAPIEKGIPEYAATVFVLDASHFVRI